MSSACKTRAQGILTPHMAQEIPSMAANFQVQFVQRSWFQLLLCIAYLPIWLWQQTVTAGLKHKPLQHPTSQQYQYQRHPGSFGCCTCAKCCHCHARRRVEQQILQKCSIVDIAAY